jgi:hypothetical protein
LSKLVTVAMILRVTAAMIVTTIGIAATRAGRYILTLFNRFENLKGGESGAALIELAVPLCKFQLLPRRAAP